MEYKRMEEDVDGPAKTPTSGGLPQPTPLQPPPPPPQQQQQVAPQPQQPYPGQTPGPQVIIVRSEGSQPIPKSKAQPLMILGVLQLVLGILLIIFNVVALAVWAALSMSGSGIWVGILVIIAGSFGIASSKTLGRCYLITFMVLSIISAAFVWNVIGFSIPGIVIDNEGTYYYYGSYNSGYRRNEAGIAMNSILLILGVVEAISSIVASAICCNALCCQPKRDIAGQVMYQNYQPQQAQPQYMVLPPGQHVQYAMPPAAAPGQHVQYAMPATAAAAPAPGQHVQYVVPQMGQNIQYAAQPQPQPGMMVVAGAAPPMMYQTPQSQPLEKKA